MNYKYCIVHHTRCFRRDLRRAQKRCLNINNLNIVLSNLRLGLPLPPRFRLHTLQGDYAGYKELHLGFDWILVFRTNGDALILERIGTHSDIF